MHGPTEQEINENMLQAVEELKRADHLIYVSLKYTRTVDVIRSIVKRIMNSIEKGIHALLIFAEYKKIISVIPSNPVQQADAAKTAFKDNAELVKTIDTYLFLRKLDRVKEYQSVREYRKHVTMITDVDGQTYEINVILIHEYFEMGKSFVKLIAGITGEGKEE